jgi:hypothetical protein
MAATARLLFRSILPALFALLVIGTAVRSDAAVFVSVAIAPPVLPVYSQPIAPGPGYIWTPGYWAYGPAGYYWVPGTWVIAPFVGALWTPGYWGWANGLYLWHAGYWGTRVGFYGGVNYGFGYVGTGFYGGYWNGGSFYYNRAVTNVDVNIVHNTYVTNVQNNSVNRVSYNGGAGGIARPPTAAEQTYEKESHIAPTAEQMQHEQTASTNHAMLASVNHGRPSIAATPQPGAFEHPNIVAAKGGSEAQAGRSTNIAHAQGGQWVAHPHAETHGGGEPRHER